MKLKFTNAKAYETAKTLFEGHDYKFTHYNTELAIRFYIQQSVDDAISALKELKILENEDFVIDDYEYRLPALENGYSIG
jgi:hypothetical protein